MPRLPFQKNISDHRVASPSGTLRAKVVRPAVPSGLPPLVVLHGISRNADELVSLFSPAAERSGRFIVIPHFCAKHWPNFQRPSPKARPDQALLALLAHLSLLHSAFGGAVDLFGHSGGAQLAHRFAMLYPQRVKTLNVAAAGWYCLPDATMAYPYGLGVNETPSSWTWARRHALALPDFLRLSVRVFVGTLDTERDASLRQNPSLDDIQGRTRIDRATTYVERFRKAAAAQRIVPDIALMRLAGVTHDVANAIEHIGLDNLVSAARSAHLAAAS